MNLIIYQVDAFTDRPFTGNPTAVCLLSAPATLASAHILWESGAVPADEQVSFTTRSGLLTARRRGD